MNYVFNPSLAYGWKMALVAISVSPVLVVMCFFQVRLMGHLQDDLRDAFGKSATLVCEQIASIRTVASLRREDALLAEFSTSLKAPVRAAMISTIKSTFVWKLLTSLTADICFQSGRSIIYQCTHFLRFLADTIRRYSTGMEVNFLSRRNIPSFNSSSVSWQLLLGPRELDRSSRFPRILQKLRLLRRVSRDSWTMNRILTWVARQENTWINLKPVILNFVTYFSPILLGLMGCWRRCWWNRPDRLVLRGLSFDIKPGQYGALVGVSGCGKSTTIGLLERFYDPIAGQVTVDGLPVSEYNLASYRKNISIISQEPTYTAQDSRKLTSQSLSGNNQIQRPPRRK